MTVAVCVIGAGCAHQPGAFRLTAPAPLLVPPTVKDSTIVRATVPIPRISGKTACAASHHGLQLERKGPTGARIVVTRDAVAATSGAELFNWTLDLEKQGCLPINESGHVAENIIDALPLDLGKRSQLLQGRADLKSINSLRVVAPVMKPGTELPASGPLADTQSVQQGANGNLEVTLKTIPSVIGYEIDWYDFAPQDGGPGYKVLPRNAEIHVNGGLESSKTPTVKRFEFGPAARWYELYMMTKVSSNDFDFVVFSAKTSEELQKSIEAFQTDATKYLQTADPTTYSVLPHGSGINAYVRVRVNGEMTDLPKGYSIQRAIAESKADPRVALAKLKVRKLHDGRLYPVQWDTGNDQILSLILEGGEELEW